MQLFAFQKNGLERSARLAADGPRLGIDLRLAVEHFAEAQGEPRLPAGEFPTTLVGLFSLGQSGMQLVRDATDWIINQVEARSEHHASGVVFDFAKASLLAPVARPGKVICIAGNYPASSKASTPDYPTVFLKPSSGVTGCGQPIIIPPVAEDVAYEVELAVVIGTGGKNMALDEALDAVAGYTIANDLGDRILEKRTSQWISGKMFDNFTPLGPVLITADEMADPGHLALATMVNGRTVQKGDTAQMFFDVPHLISYLSTLTSLAPGDVILTGSPKLLDGEPNPPCALKHGDRVEVKIEGFIPLINPIIFETQVG